MKTSKPAIAITFAVAAALAAGVVEHYSRNARGIVVTTQPTATATEATTTEVKDGNGGNDEASVEDGRGDGIRHPTAEDGAHGSVLRATGVDRPENEAANLETRRLAETQAARLRPVRVEPSIVRLSEHWCAVIAPGALTYTELGVTRRIDAPFSCSKCLMDCHPSWFDGSTPLIVTWPDGSAESWSVEVPR